MAIYKKLLNIQKDIKGLKKDSNGFNYSYLSGDKLLSTIKPLMNKEGLLLKQEVLKTTSEVIKYNKIDKKTGREIESTEILYNLELKFTWIDTDSSETDVNMFTASGMNAFDKGIGSALTYAERYFILKYFHIPTDEDDVDYINKQREEEKKKAEEEKKEKLEKVSELDKRTKAIQLIEQKLTSDKIKEILKDFKLKSLWEAKPEELKTIFENFS